MGYYFEYEIEEPEDEFFNYFKVINIPSIRFEDSLYKVYLGNKWINLKVEDQQNLSEEYATYILSETSDTLYHKVEALNLTQSDYPTKKPKYTQAELDNYGKKQEVGGRCEVCPTGLYLNGICDMCGIASKAEVAKHRSEWDQTVKDNPSVYGDYTCPTCNGNGCKKCKYKGILTPY